MNSVIQALRCPVCGSRFSLSENQKSLLCEGSIGKNNTFRRHCFDFAAGGYINLAPPSQSLSGDSREAVRSRTRFLDGGYYAPIRDAVKDAVSRHSSGGLAVDAGCGEGYYTTAIADVASSVAGFDLSKTGIDAAAKRARREGKTNALFAVAGIYDMPLSDLSADAVISIFAPCAEAEFSRILRPGGIVVAVGAGEDHLFGLKQAVYDRVYKNNDRADMPKSLAFVERKEVKYTVTLTDSTAILDLFSMTPYYYRTSESDLAKLKSLTSLTTEVHAFVEVYRKP